MQRGYPSTKRVQGGVQRIFVSEDPMDFTITGQSITAFDSQSGAANNAMLYAYDINPASTPQAGGASSLNVGDAGNSHTHTITSQFVGLTSGSLEEIVGLSDATGLTVFVETYNADNDDTGASYLVYGVNREMTLASADAATGVALNDLSGVPFTIVGTSTNPAYVLDGDLASVAGSGITINE